MTSARIVMSTALHHRMVNSMVSDWPMEEFAGRERSQAATEQTSGIALQGMPLRTECKEKACDPHEQRSASPRFRWEHLGARATTDAQRKSGVQFTRARPYPRGSISGRVPFR